MPTAVEQSAARELQDALRRVTGVELPIVSEEKAATGRAYFIGNTETARGAIAAATSATFPKQGELELGNVKVCKCGNMEV